MQKFSFLIIYQCIPDYEFTDLSAKDVKLMHLYFLNISFFITCLNKKKKKVKSTSVSISAEFYLDSFDMDTRQSATCVPTSFCLVLKREL